MRKQRICAWILAFVLILGLPAAVCAEEGDAQSQLSYIVDDCGTFTDGQYAELERSAAQIGREFGVSVYIVVLSDYRKYSDAPDFFACCDEIYRQYDLGWGTDRDGIMLALSMAGRDYALLVHGSRAQRAFDEKAQDRLEACILEYFGKDDYYNGFREYMRLCRAELNSERAEGSHNAISFLDVALKVLLPALVVTAVVCLVLYLPMRSVKKKNDADEYVPEDGVEITVRKDRFIHRTVSRTPRQRESVGSGSSGGSSGRSGKF